MTVAPTENPAGDARQLRSQLESAFKSNNASEHHKTTGFDDLLSGLRAGQFGGSALKGDAPAALIALLKNLGWTVAVEKFARALPHYPPAFGEMELRDTMRRLGYEGRSRFARLAEVTHRQLPALVFAEDGQVSILANPSKGHIIALDPETGAERTLSSRRRYQIVCFKPTSDQAEPMARGSWILATFRRFQREILVLFGLTFVINLMVLAASFAVMSIYDVVIPSGSFDTLIAIAIGISFAFYIELSLRRIKASMIGHIGGRLEYLLSTAIWSKLLSLPFHMLIGTSVGEQIGRIRQFEGVRDLFSGPFVAIGLELPFVVLLTIVLFLMAGPLAIVPVLLIVAYAITGALLIAPLRRLNAEASRRRTEHQQTALETVSNLRQLRSYGCEDVWLARLAQKAALSATAKRKAALHQRFLTSASAAGIPIAGGGTVVLGAALAISGNITTGTLIGAMIVIWRILAPIQQTFMMLSRYTELSQMFQQIDRLMQITSSTVGAESPLRRVFDGSVTFDRVTFRYAGATDSSIQGISFAIKPGTMVAVEGASGSGKSTLLRLILNLYQPQSGAVSIDNINVRQISEQDLRATIGYVPQNPVLFHGTIAQNLRLAAPGASDDELYAACTEVGLREAIDSLANGVNTMLDHARQASLPKGFLQSVSIAQALLRKPKVLLLDEPAKTLDPHLEQAFLDAIARHRHNTTIIMVTHRPSHARLADLVLKLERGQMTALEPPAAAQKAAGSAS